MQKNPRHIFQKHSAKTLAQGFLNGAGLAQDLHYSCQHPDFALTENLLFGKIYVG